MQRLTGGLTKHVFGGNDCGDMYMGPLGRLTPEDGSVDIFACHMEKIRKASEYKFMLAFENAYHEFWSWDYVTEKIFDAFKSKTVAVYYGCYNIEKKIPKELYIDYRDFENDDELSSYLCSFSEKAYQKMVDEAYIFYKKTQPTFLRDFKKILKELA